MINYIDGFALPIPKKHLEDYRKVAEKVAEVWKEHGALSYCEYVGDDLTLEGTRSFMDFLDATSEDAIIFGWVEFESRESRDIANQRVAADPRMTELLRPITDPTKKIFDGRRMAYGGFKPLVSSFLR
ncbi:MAG: DUF1428 family protein [Chitinophagales bacterium]|nr:DUF1428 family protein [Chitinophagales bacterium]